MISVATPLAPPPLLSYWPVPDDSVVPQSSEIAQILSACVAGWRHAAAPPPPGTASCPHPIGRVAAAVGHTHRPPALGSGEKHRSLDQGPL